jgi:hypothetical protein
MSDDQQNPQRDLEREERRLERVRLASVIAFPERSDDDDDPKPAA